MVEEPRDHAFQYVLQDARILVTDDDPIAREFASVYLSTPTAVVETADCGEEALERLRQKPFDLVVVDLDMPGMGGLDMIRRVRAIPSLSQLPIVVVTSHEDIISIDRAYEAGATSFATKPVNWRLFSYQLRYLLRSHRTRLGPALNRHEETAAPPTSG